MTTLNDLRLVRVLPSYPQYELPSTGTFPGSDVPEDSDARVFWAVDHDMPDYVRLIVPMEGDGRGVGFYRDSGDPDGHKGWNVPKRYVVELPYADYARIGEPARTVETARDLRKGDVFHTAHDTTTQYVATGDANNGTVPIKWQGMHQSVPTVIDWVGPGVPARVTLVPESDWTEQTRALLAELSSDDQTPGEVLGKALTDDAYARGVADGRAAVEREVEAWKERATRIAHDYANQNSLCSEFDRCMEEVGLSPREQEFEVTVTETVCYSFTVTARDSDDAYEIAGDDYRDLDTYPSREVQSIEFV